MIRWLLRTLGLFLVLIVGAIAAAALYYSFPDHKFRLAIEVDTPDGPKIASSVLEVYQSNVSWGLPEARGLRQSLKGEAVFLDLGHGKHVIMLLAHGANAQDQSKIIRLPGIAFRAAGKPAHWSQLATLTGKVALEGENVPTLVTFVNLNDPKTAHVVTPDAFESVFGTGYRFKRSWIEMTNDSTTWRIDKSVPLIKRLSVKTKEMQLMHLGDPFRARLGQFIRR